MSRDHSSSRFRRYLLLTAGVFGSGALAVLAFVAAVDPYRLYQVVEAPGFNAVKPGLTRHQEVIKLHHAEKLRPQAVILGNSRAEIGFNPDALTGQRAYNLAIPGTGLASSSRELRHLYAAGVKPATVVAGLDFMDFLARAKKPGAASAAPGVAAPGGAGPGWRFDTAFSLASLKDAVGTLRIQRDPEAVTMTAGGFNPLLEYQGHVRNEGYHALFAQAAGASEKRLRDKAPIVLDRADFAHLRAMLAPALAEGADVRLLIYPYHAQMLAMFERHGLWPLFEQWKAQTVAEVELLRAQYPGARITLLDFSGFGPYQCEPIPSRQERSRATRWYWEAGHFKQELGALVLARLLARPGAPADFGAELRADTLAGNAARIGAERQACIAAQPGLFAPP